MSVAVFTLLVATLLPGLVLVAVAVLRAQMVDRSTLRAGATQPTGPVQPATTTDRSWCSQP